MPDQSPEALAVKWLDDKWPAFRRVCPICAEAAWSISGPYAATVLDGRDVQLGTYAPVMFVTCQNCAFTHQFSAVLMGIFEGKNDG